MCAPGSTGCGTPTSAGGTTAPSIVTVAALAPSPLTVMVSDGTRGSSAESSVCASVWAPLNASGASLASFSRVILRYVSAASTKRPSFS